MRDVRLADATKIASNLHQRRAAEAFAYHAKTLESNPERLFAGVRERLGAGTDISADAYIEAQRCEGRCEPMWMRR